MTGLRGSWRPLSASARRFLSVLSEGSPGFLLVGGLALAFIVGWFFGTGLEGVFRYAGAVLQVCGLLLIAHGLNKTRAMFGRPTITNRVSNWLWRLATSGRSRNVVISVGVGQVSLAGSTVVGHGSAAGGTLERRVEMLEADIQALRKDVGESTDRMRQEIGSVRSELSAEVDRRTKADTRMERLVEEIAVGGLHLEWVGLLWLIVATVLSAFPSELARLF